MNEIGSIEQELREEGVYASTTAGYSMWPMLRDRKDRVVICAKGEKRLKKWDVALYRYPDGKYVLHRVIGVKNGYYRVRGDNTFFLEKIPEEWILGYVSEFYRGEKHCSTTSKGYRFYAAAWHLIYVFRLLFHKMRCFAASAKNRLLGKKKKS